MTNRYRSSCCCDDQQESVCFLGYGAVPKTGYRPQDACHSSSTFESKPDFNRHDNWSFCVHDTDEQLVAVIERQGYKNFAPVSWPSDNECNCECLAETEDTGINSSTITREPIVVWYKHPFIEGEKSSNVPSEIIEDPYYWHSYSQYSEDVSPQVTRSNTFPCGCTDHKYDAASGCRSDFFCNEGYFSWCGWTDGTNNGDDEQLYWWADPAGNISYLTQSQMDLIGHPDRDGWRTSENGYVRGGPSRNNNVCDTTSDGNKVGFGLVEGSPRKQMNGDYLYLQDIVTKTNNSGELHPHYSVRFSSDLRVSVEPNYNWGTCSDFPYGLWPLGFTFIGTMHRVKWWQQYWNSISVNDVCPGGTCGDSGCECGLISDIYAGKFAETCRVPKYAVSQCAGVPLFSGEVVIKCDFPEAAGIPQDIIDTRPDPSLLTVYVLNGVDILRYIPNSLGAYVMGCIRAGSFMDPRVTDYLEKVGILPPPLDYGEEQDYRIFKKSIPTHIVGGDGGVGLTGHCCVNLTVSPDFGSPLACDCGVEGAIHCGFTGSLEEAEAAGISSCWVFNGETGSDIDADVDGTPDGIECARFICGEIPGESYEDFLQILIDDGRFTSIFDRDSAVEQSALCCENEWDQDCPPMAQLATQYAESSCGPPTLCFDVGINVCRSFLGGQFFPGVDCLDTIEDPNGEPFTCKARYEGEGGTTADTYGSLCILKKGALDPAGGEAAPGRVHCIEILSQTVSDIFDGLVTGSSREYTFDELINVLTDNRNVIERDAVNGAAPGSGDDEGQLDILIQYLLDNPNEIGAEGAPGYRVRFKTLSNCEPLCEFGDTIGLTLNNNARVCDTPTDEEPTRAGDCDYPETTYPCCTDENPICFLPMVEKYFYGRPGEWRPVCGGNANLPDPSKENEIVQEYFQSFFPQNTQRTSAVKTNCPGRRCWTAQPFPIKQTSETVPSGKTKCPDRDGEKGCIDVIGTPEKNCGEPLLAVCGNGSYNGVTVPVDEVTGDIVPEYPGAYNYGNGTNYDILNELCNQEGYSYTCFGAWYQASLTGFVFVGEDDDNCSSTYKYRCASVNNAFFLRVPPGITHNDEFCQNYDVKFALHEVGEDGGGGSDNPEWEGVPGSPAFLVYHNRVLDDFIQFYGGCTHVITQGDSDAIVGNLFENQTLPDGGMTAGDIVKWDLFKGDPTGEYGFPGGWTQWVTNTSDLITVSRNNGDPSDSSNPYEITVKLQDFTFDDIPEDVWWGLVKYEPEDDVLEDTPAGSGDAELPISNPASIWPASTEQNKIKIKIKQQNPGDVPNGLRDYQWYNAPIKREGPLPSGKFIAPGSPCWRGSPCCHTKITQRYGGGPVVCDFWKADNVQGTPGGESECNFDILPSNGSDLPDPICGVCPEGTYCCPYTERDVEGNLGRCIPEDTYCCDCPADKLCEKNISGSLECVDETDEIQRLDFTPDHRGVAWRTISSSSERDHWKIDDVPKDSNNLSILRKSNPNATDSSEDAVKYLVDEYFEPLYQQGYRRFSLRGAMGMRTGSDLQTGSGVPSAIWSAGDPNLGTWNDKQNIGTVQSDGPEYEYPFTSTGNLVSEDSSAVIGNMQQSYINFLKPWIQSKKDAGDPIDFYIYGAYQAAFFDDGTPARGNLAIALYSDGDWASNRDTDEGTKWRDRFPLPDFSNPAHVDFFDGEIDPWIEIGVTGFIIDAASNASSNVPTNTSPPVQRPPGFFDYFRNKGVNVLGEAVPLSSYGTDAGFGEGADINDNLYKETGFVGYHLGKRPEDVSIGNFWRNRWTNFFISPEDSEIHINLVWRFAGNNAGFNSEFATGVGNDVVYDIEGMKAEIDEMTERGFVVSTAFGPYSSPTPVNEGPARDEILKYILQRNTQSTVFGGGVNSSARVPFHVLNGDTESMHFMISFQMSAPDDNDPEDIEDYINKTDAEIRQGFKNHINAFDDRGSTPGVRRSEYLNENTTGYVMFDLEKPLNYGSIDNTKEELTWFTEGLIRRIQIFREFCPNAKICVWRLGNPDFRVGYSQFPNGGLNDIDFNTLLENSVFASKVEYNGESLYDAIDVYAPVLYQYYAEGDEFGVAERILNGDRVEQIKTVRDRFLLEHGVSKPCIPIMKFEYIDIGVGDQNVTNGTNADDMNAPEITKLIQDRVTNNIMFWLGGSWSDTFSFETKKDRLVDLINDIRSTPKDPTIIILDPRSGEPIDDTDAETLPSNEYGGYQ